MTDAELLQALDRLRNTMVAVSTGGPRIQAENPEFELSYDQVSNELRRRAVANPIPYRSLWDWYGRWSSGDLPSYQSRRQFVASLFTPLIERIRTGYKTDFEPTGWERVDRTVGELRNRLAAAQSEEQHQAVGLLCREALISTAQAVYVAEKHPALDGVAISETDAKRMLEAYIAVEMGGGANEYLRKHTRAALDLAVNLQHKRTAAFRDAAICVEATTAIINTIAIMSGRRDPTGQV